MKKSLIGLCFAVGAAMAPNACLANGLASLSAFLSSAQSARADFVQTVTSPLKAGESAARTKTSSGSFDFQRPAKFRFLTKKPFEQSIVSDGQTLWLYDPDLNQVTTRKLGAALASSPAMLIASAANLADLEKAFALKDLPSAGGLNWVQATPRAADGQVQKIEIAFKADTAGGAALAQLVVIDSFGQRAVMQFSNLQSNPGFAADAFKFKPPPGADVLPQ